MEGALAQYDNYVATLLFALFQLVVLSLILERALYIAFDIKYWRDYLESGPKAIIVVVVSIGVCVYYDFDVFSRVIDLSGGSSLIGVLLTGFVVSGGSAGAKRLMQDFLKLSREHREAYKKQLAQS